MIRNIHLYLPLVLALGGCQTPPQVQSPFRPITVIWNSYQAENFSGRAHLMDDGKRGSISAVAVSGVKCTGTYDYLIGTKGVWSLTCSNGRTVGGQLFGRSGAGKDDLGNSVSILISN